MRSIRRCWCWRAMSKEAAAAAGVELSDVERWRGLSRRQLDYAKMQITAANYELRPEIIESTYYLYHYTHDREIPGDGEDLLRCAGEVLPDG